MDKARCLPSITIWLILIGIIGSGCFGPINIPAESVETPLTVSLASPFPAITPTFTKAHSQGANFQSLLLYERWNDAEEWYGSWIRTVDGQVDQLISEKLAPLSWSPDGKRILLISKRSAELYVAKYDGTDPVLLMRNPSQEEFPHMQAWWIGDEYVLVEKDFWDPDVYLLSAESGEVLQIYPDHMVLSVNPSQPYWIQEKYSIVQYEFVTVEGEVFPINDIQLQTERISGYAMQMAISPLGNEIYYSRCTKEPKPSFSYQCNLYRATIEEDYQLKEQPILEVSQPIQNMRISPNGEFLAFTDVEAAADILKVINLRGLEIMAEFLLDTKAGPLPNLWSPDSEELAIQEVKISPAYSTLIYHKLASNDTIRYSYKNKDLTVIVDWKFIELP